MRARLVGLAMIVAFALGALAWTAPGRAAQPCCNITGIDAKTQTVTARETRTGRTFQFKVADTRALGALKVGQAVHADFKTMKVSVRPDAVQPCCSIVNLRGPAAAPVR